jgi:hypothetical protein
MLFSKICQKYVPFKKGKVLPRTGHEGPEGEYRYSSTLSLTSALDRGGWSTPRPGRFTPGNDPVPIVQEAGWAPGPVWTVLCTMYLMILKSLKIILYKIIFNNPLKSLNYGA